MNFEIEKDIIKKYSNNLFGITSGKAVLPTHSCFLVKANSETHKVTIQAVNSNLVAFAEFDAMVNETGEAVVNAKLFNDLVQSVPSTVLLFSLEDDILRIRYGGSKFELRIVEDSQFPIAPAIQIEKKVSMDASIFKEMVKNTIFATYQEDNNTPFKGIFWKITPEEQIMAATDIAKMAEFVFVSPNEIETSHELIADTSIMRFLDRIIEDDSVLTVFFHENKLVFSYHGYTIFGSVIESTYPNYRAAYPHEEKRNPLVINKTLLKNVIKRVSLVVSEELLRIELQFTDENELIVSAKNRELGNAKDTIKDIQYDGNPIKINLNYQQIISILDVIHTEEVLIDIGDANTSPLIITNIVPADEDDGKKKVKFLLMPLRQKR